MRKSIAFVLALVMFLLGAYSAASVQAQDERRNGTLFGNRGVYLPAVPMPGDDLELGTVPCHVEAVEQEWVLCKSQVAAGYRDTWRNLNNGASYTAPRAPTR